MEWNKAVVITTCLCILYEIYTDSATLPIMNVWGGEGSRGLRRKKSSGEEGNGT